MGKEINGDVVPKTEPILKGKFALYITPDGGYHLAFRPDGEDEDKHMHVPGAAIKLAEKMSGMKNPFAMIMGKG